MDAFGVRPAIQQMVERIAGWGYVVLAPNIFYRGGRDPVHLPEDPEKRGEYFGAVIRPLIEQLTSDRLAADGAAYLDVLRDAGATEPFAITGYCMGGRVGWWIAAGHPGRVAALGAFHTAGLVTEDEDSPHLTVPDAELYFGFGDEDPGATPEQIATLKLALDETGATYRSEVYEGAKHGFTQTDFPVYDEEAAERHFRELRALLERTLS